MTSVSSGHASPRVKQLAGKFPPIEPDGAGRAFAANVHAQGARRPAARWEKSYRKCGISPKARSSVIKATKAAMICGSRVSGLVG
jgi:hypothetical protein